MHYLVGWPAAGRCERHLRALAEVWEQNRLLPRQKVADEEQNFRKVVEEDRGEAVEEVVAVDPRLQA